MNWKPADGRGVAIDAYVVTAVQGKARGNQVVTSGDAASVAVSGLVGGAQYTLSVVAMSECGSGPAGVSGVVTPTGSATTYASLVIGDSPAAYYRLGEAPGLEASFGGDSSGHGHLLDYVRLSLGAAGALVEDPDTAATVDGNCCLGYASPTLPIGNAARTVEAWIRPADGNARWVAGWGRNETNRGFDVGVAGPIVFVNTYGVELGFTADHTTADGAWHHVVVTYDGSKARAYLDGESLGSQTFDAPLDTFNASGLVVGAYQTTGSPFYGDLDEVAIYPTALTPTQITTHYGAGH